ncbi:OLC1v1025473C1 [Oldenlandia corymbosa var. corymbosa]|uniref:OLC1v1025473C1 n=1 Tax=Oldenlandia corymbosa var. corymbosa TaxID=529605 RepID=A0AAV1C4S9_OLDCO|nr:OLC1v1025473C1 [Oldenlandia corymbosa var. corymbosa]
MSSTNTTTTSSTDEGLVLPDFPNELFDYLYHQQQFMDALDDVPFVGATEPATVSDDTSFGDDVIVSGSDDIFSIPGGCDETMYLIHDLTGTPASSTASGAANAATVVTPENSATASNNTSVDLSPKVGIAKQVKRRSRASKRTPTTLLNASIKNFRSLVQQYTGSQSSTSGFNRNGKGPITLNFGAPNDRRNNFPVTFGNYQYSVEQVDHQIYGGQ